jgi:hypothetical protein
MSDRQRLTPPPDRDVAVAASPELVDLFGRVTRGDGGVGPLGRFKVREMTTLRAVFMVPENGWSAVGKAAAMAS